MASLLPHTRPVNPPFYVSPEGMRSAGFDAILAALAERATSTLGKTHALALPFLPTQAHMAEAMARIDEARALRHAQLPLPQVGFPDIAALLARLRIEAPLEGQELLRVKDVLDALCISRRMAQHCRALAPLLQQTLATLPDVADIFRTLSHAIAPDGTVVDTASLGLARAREQVRRLAQRIRTQMEGYLTDEAMVPYLQDSYVSIRHDRYVLPINASFAARVPGIIHNASQTGQTVFIEPTAITSLGNALALAQAHEAEEVLRVLVMLSQELTARVPDIQAGIDSLVALDVTAAAASLADDLHLHAPKLLAEDADLSLPELRHPELQLTGQQAVANTLTLGGTTCVLLISGPNGGGKTVVLTGLACAVLMARAGLPIAAARGARMPVYRGLFCTVGDAQKLASGLSSFAAQLTALKNITERVAPGWLVLIDELGGDTDPVAGAALARAVLDHGADRGAHLCATTHLSALKSVALTDPRYVNACMGYDAQDDRPTYELLTGMPGPSRALDLARRIGFDEAILAAAQQHLGSDGAVSAALQALGRAQDDLQQQTQAAQALRLQLQAAHAEHRDAEAKHQAARAQAQSAHQDQLRELYRAAKERIAGELAAVRAAAHKESALSRAAHAIGQAAQSLPAPTADMAQGLPPVTDAALLQPGMWVHVRAMGQRARVTHVGADFVTVAMGALRTRVALAGLSLMSATPQPKPQAASKKEPGTQSRPSAEARAVGPAAVVVAPSRCDLRGLRLDEAERLLIRALDVCLSEGQRALWVIHGHGTGRLKEGLHDLLRGSPYVASFRVGESHEGGQGVTVVQLDG